MWVYWMLIWTFSYYIDYSYPAESIQVTTLSIITQLFWWFLVYDICGHFETL